uniref:Ubiquitin carboxyl-terminal hydrolase n=1 Tax=Hanusia phi TaxID=3032 RepID=A0A7S0NC19_9CRYP
MRWKKIPKEPKENQEAEAPTKMAIGVEGGFQVDEELFDYEKSNFLALLPDRVLIPLPNQELPELISMVIDGILKASDLTEDEAQVMAWEDKRQVSKYAQNLVQVNNGKKISPDPKTWKCEESGMTENLWLNLSDGHIGSGRAQMDATGQMSGGTGAALNHYYEQKRLGNEFPLVVKLGTITAKGADVYSYAADEDDMVEDPKLAEHLSHWGINMMQMEKTEKTIAEMEIDMNNKFDFDKICESGKQLQTLSGPGFVGLKNLGNSCYVNSVVQVLFSLPDFQERFFKKAPEIFQSTPSSASADDILVQAAKLGTGLLSEKYSKPAEGSEGAFVSPQMFKFLVGKGHPEFSTGNQQDAFEYYQYLLEKLERGERAKKGSEQLLSRFFEFEIEERLQCKQSGKVKYTQSKEKQLSLLIPLDAATNKDEVQSYEERNAKRQKNEISEAEKEEPVKAHIPFDACISSYMKEVVVEDYLSPATGSKGAAVKSTRIKRFPKYLCVHMRRYVLGEDWRPKKLDAMITLPETLDLESLRSQEHQPGEELLPESASGSASAGPVPDEAIVRQLVDMGFGENGCKRAALATNNASAEAAMEWVLQHMGDPDFNEPISAPSGQSQAGSATVDPDAVEMLCSMGFAKHHAERALRETGGDIQRASDWLLSRVDELDAMDVEEASQPAPQPEASVDYQPQYDLVGFISHIGSNTACGHYVCHIKKNGKWTIFNDRKVALSEDPPISMGYMYIYQSKGLK